jgi:hypothetical protein
MIRSTAASVFTSTAAIIFAIRSRITALSSISPLLLLHLS